MTTRQPKGTPVGGQFAQERKPDGDDLTTPTPPMTTDRHGTKRWYRNGKLHRDDGPAVEWPDGGKEWYRNGLLHRENGPALEWPDGYRVWLLNGQTHRDDGPALEWGDGIEGWWYRDGVRVPPPEGENQ